MVIFSHLKIRSSGDTGKGYDKTSTTHTESTLTRFSVGAKPYG